MPWYLSLVFIVIGWLFKVVYDWKIQPAITKAHKKQEKKEIEEEERKKRQRQERIDNLNRAWKNEREILRNVQQSLREFNQMNRFPGTYKASKCLELATYIEREVQKIERPEFKEIKGKLLEYASRKNQINQNTGLQDLMKLFQKRIEPNKYEPLILSEEIEEILKASSIPPFSESDL